MPQDGFGYQRFKEKLQQLKTGSSSNKKFIWEMSLEECLDAQEKYLKWIDKNPNHPERETKEHLYNHYLLPRIEEFQLNKTVNELPEFKEDKPKSMKIDALGNIIETGEERS